MLQREKDNTIKKNSSIYNWQDGATVAASDRWNLLDGELFLAKCLPHFDNNPASVADALLENNLPLHLANLDRSLAKPPQPPTRGGLISERFSFLLNSPKNMPNHYPKHFLFR